ncbi:MAG: energy-coupling factor transporter transmembrane component T family protein [Christensenellales bacterium]|jgi:energy-coupling factor transport system permease protein
MNNITFGQYYPVESPVHRLDPRIKILAVVLYIVVIFFIKSFSGYAVTAAFVAFVILLSKVPVKSVLRSVKGILILIAFTAFINIVFYKEGRILINWWIIKITLDGVLFAAKMALRLLLLVMGTSLLTLTTTPVSLTDGIESLLTPLKWIKFPVHDVAIIMSITLRMIPALMEETNKIIMAQKARGADFETGGLIKRAKALIPILIPLFVGAFRRADELAYALDARCYNATPKRTRMKVMKITPADILGIIMVLGYSAVIIIDVYILHGLF